MAKKGWLADKKQKLLTPWKPRKKTKARRKSRKMGKVFSL